MGWGSSTRRGGGRKVCALPRSLSSLGFEERNLGCVGNFAGMSWTLGGVQKVCAKKRLCAFSVPSKFQARHTARPLVCGELSRSGLKFSIEIEIFIRRVKPWRYPIISHVD